LLHGHNFYLPLGAPFQMGRNIVVTHSEKLETRHRGLTLPTWLAVLMRRYAQLQNRFNRFRFGVPFQTNPPGIVSELFELNESMRGYNSENLPALMPLTSSLALV